MNEQDFVHKKQKTKINQQGGNKNENNIIVSFHRHETMDLNLRSHLKKVDT